MNLSDFHAKPVISHILNNGFKLLAYQDNTNPIVCLQLYIKTGSVTELKSQKGYAHFLEHLLFKNTRKYPNNEITRIVPKLGAMINAYTDYDTTCYYLHIPAEQVDTGLEILAEMAIHARLNEEDIKVEKDIIVEEIRQYESDPETSFIEYIQNTYFIKSPLKNPVLGTEKSLKEATLRKLKHFFRIHYRPDNAFLVATGDFDLRVLQDSVAAQFSQWEPKSQSLSQVTTPFPERTTFQTYSRISKGHELLAFTLPELDEKHPDSEALHIAIRHFAIGKSSLLYKELVENKKLCTNVKVNSLSGLNPGISVIMLYPLNRRHIPAILSYFSKQLEVLMKHELDSENLQMIKNDILHSWVYSFEGVENLANLIAAEEFNGDLERVYTYGSYINSITSSQVSSALKKYWKNDYLALYHQGRSLCKAVQDFKLPQFVNQTNQKSPTVLQAYHRYTFDNGLKLIYNYLPGKQICGFALSTKLSQLCESQPGVNYFTSLMMLYATQYRTHEDILRLTRKHGFNIRLIHHADSTTFRGKCHQEDLFKALDLLGEIVTKPKFDRSYLGFLKQAALDNLHREKDYPPGFAFRKWFEQVFGKHNNLFYAFGNASRVKAINMNTIENWHNEWLYAQQYALCIAGGIEPELLISSIENSFKFKAVTPEIQTLRPSYELSKPNYRLQRKAMDQAIIHIGGLGCSAQEIHENTAFHQLAQILGGDLSSRLFNILREKYGYAYQCGFDFVSYQDLGYWYAYAFCDASDYQACFKLMQEILDDILCNGVTEDELESAKNYLIGMSRFDQESVSFRASSISSLVALDYDLGFYLSREQRIKDVNADLVNSLAARWLKDRWIHILV